MTVMLKRTPKGKILEYLEELIKRRVLSDEWTDLIDETIMTLKEQDGWIPVEKELPKSMANKVIVYAEHEDLISRIGYAHYERHKEGPVWYDLETHEPFINEGYTVTHWMRMPKSPEGETLILS